MIDLSFAQDFNQPPLINKKYILPTQKPDEIEGFHRLGHSNWTICNSLNPFCSVKFPTSPLSYWEANSYYHRGPIMRYNNPAARGILGKMSAPSDSKNCPRTVDCAAVEVRGQFLESRGRTFFPVCRVLPGYYNIITRELRFLRYHKNGTCIMKNSTVIIQVLNMGP